ncbi:type II toxin-antitoxin system death-on-curing family toxin [Tychonema sp. LEGE 07199]|uniref:type II toxin-antitoxin system death-on-curing family toxin n=1 Tax=unclassified Tychonema TaxID=2642144 RepID=UPI00187FD004|nr:MULTISPECIES: type II toxin-antitoxin system death-on-curing family toxin [unclassified Tychonema]MBE9119550.1 type II toxin-antitoxin system death-on-curing family toxin [Tychonema sp. LEGE 07199]MBE9131754.1 type II toxin-antitoxin system death-on-curing family toxin [Tychonema sp. LEGE 07196]
MQTPRFISIDEVLELHEDQISSFGGTSGVRDEGLLESALAQPQATFGGQLLHPTISEQAAAYLYHLAMNHPFMDGNKRTAFAVADTFLRLNGCALNLTDDRAYNLVMEVARGTMTKEELSTEFESCIVAF